MSMAESTSVRPIRSRQDGRKGLLVYLDADLIKEALDDDCNVYDIVEEAARDWLRKRNSRRKE